MAKKKFHFSPSSPITNSFNLLKEFREQAKAHQLTTRPSSIFRYG